MKPSRRISKAKKKAEADKLKYSKQSKHDQEKAYANQGIDPSKHGLVLGKEDLRGELYCGKTVDVLKTDNETIVLLKNKNPN